MKYFYDTEFLEDGTTIRLISIGIVSEDGRSYYAINRNFSWEYLHRPEFSFVREYVWHHIPRFGDTMALDICDENVKRPDVIAQEVREFLLGPDGSKEIPHIELWADYPAYDHVVLCQLWGRMIDRPLGIPARTNDIIQFAEMIGIAEDDLENQDGYPIQLGGTRHHALYDASHNHEVFQWLCLKAVRIIGSELPSQEARQIVEVTDPATDDEYHRAGVYCGEPVHCTPPHPGALPGTPYAPQTGPEVGLATP